MSQDIYTMYEDDKKLLNIYQQIDQASIEKQKALRQDLYHYFKKRYKRFTNMGLVQLQFFLSDATSFLRMNHPNIFGDKPSDIRDTVRFSHQNHEMNEGFEVGKTTHGFRFVYPLFNAKKDYLGSMEISFSSAKLIDSLIDSYMLDLHFLINKQKINHNLQGNSDISLYEESFENKDFLLETATHHDFANEYVYKHILSDELLQTISQNMNKGLAFSITRTHNFETVVGSFIPVRASHSSKVIAYLIVFAESDYLDTLIIEERYIQLLFFTVLILVFLFSLYITSNQAKLHEMAHYDKLTKLPNRAYFYIGLEQELKRASRLNNKLAVMFIDLDGFKSVNDNYGHNVGDELLIMVAQRLLKCIRNIDIIARIGGDEFTIVLPDLNTQEDAQLVAQKIISSLSEAFIIYTNKITIGASIGISIFPDYSKDSDELIKQSDNAMYQAKAQGKNTAVLYSEDSSYPLKN